MVAQQLPLAAPAHNNRQLFADHYLDVTLPARGDWQLRAATVAPLLARIAALYAAFTPSTIEAQTERDLVQPILAALGLCWPGLSSTRRQTWQSSSSRIAKTEPASTAGMMGH